MLVSSSARNAIRSFQKKRITNGAAKCIQVATMREMIFGGAVVKKVKIELAASLVSMRPKTMMRMKRIRFKGAKVTITMCGVCAGKKSAIQLSYVLEILT